MCHWQQSVAVSLGKAAIQALFVLPKEIAKSFLLNNVVEFYHSYLGVILK